MNITLNTTFSSNNAVDEFDTRQIKKALNRLGYYRPLKTTGITGIPDSRVFAALKEFQKDQGLVPTGTARPGDETVKALSRAAGGKAAGTYIWRTVGDDKVRADHAALNGTVRDLSDSPDPGEEFNCRCWADFKGLNLEALKEIPTGLHQEVVSSLYQSSQKWIDEDFINHWKHGKGQEVTLPNIGWLVEIIEHAKKIMFHKVEKQIADKARQVKTGSFTDTWERSYNFQDIVFSIGDAVIRGRFTGTVKKDKNILHVEAIAYYLLDDEFADPSSVRQNLLGSSDPDILWDNMIGDATLYITEAGNTPYPITGTWMTKVTGSIQSAN